MVHSDGKALLRFYHLTVINIHQSLNEPSPGDYKLQTQLNTHSVIGILIIKEVVQQGRVNEMIPPQMKQWH